MPDGRRANSPSRIGGVSGNGNKIVASSKLRMDREPVVSRISDPSLGIGKRKEIDNVMKKARASTSDSWNKKLLDIEEKDPNRWRHTGYKKLYVEGSSSGSDSEMETFRYSNARKSPNRSPPSLKKSSISPGRKDFPRALIMRKRSPKSPIGQPRSPPAQHLRNRAPKDLRLRPRSPRSPKSPIEVCRRSPEPVQTKRRSPILISSEPKHHSQVIPRSKRPPSPPPQKNRSSSQSSASSCSDDSCSVCSPKLKRARSRSRSISASHSRLEPRSPPSIKPSSSASHHHSRGSANNRRSPYLVGYTKNSSMHRNAPHVMQSSSIRPRSISPPLMRDSLKYQDEKMVKNMPAGHKNISSRPKIANEMTKSQVKRPQTIKNRQIEDPRLKKRPVPESKPVFQNVVAKKPKSRTEKPPVKVKVEGKKREDRSSSSCSDGSSSTESSLPTLTATTRLTLSERFGKMAQWSIDRSNIENMRITKDSTGGELKVMIEEGVGSPANNRNRYSPAPAGHFPEELLQTAPSGLLSWDDVRVRYEYYKNIGYLRDLNLQDYMKWEDWWYKYQEWLKQERYYEFWERQHINRRRRKKMPIAQRLN